MIIYRVFDWDIDGREEFFKTLREARKAYKKAISENPDGSWRIYRDKETRGGHFVEDCLAAHNQ